MRSVRVLVAGDQKAVRDGPRLMLGLLGVEVPGAAASGTRIVDLLVGDPLPRIC